MKRIALYGAGGHGKVVADIARACGYEPIFIDDKPHRADMSFDEYQARFAFVPVVPTVGDNQARKRIYRRCREASLTIATLVHPSAILGSNVVLGEGTVVMPGVIVNADAHIGACCILNTGCIVEHDNRIESFVHLSPRVVCGGGVYVEEEAHIGLGSSLLPQVRIGKRSIIGAASTVVNDIQSDTVAYGSPCQIRRKIDG